MLTHLVWHMEVFSILKDDKTSERIYIFSGWQGQESLRTYQEFLWVALSIAAIGTCQKYIIFIYKTVRSRQSRPVTRTMCTRPYVDFSNKTSKSIRIFAYFLHTNVAYLILAIKTLILKLVSSVNVLYSIIIYQSVWPCRHTALREGRHGTLSRWTTFF